MTLKLKHIVLSIGLTFTTQAYAVGPSVTPDLIIYAGGDSFSLKRSFLGDYESGRKNHLFH